MTALFPEKIAPAGEVPKAKKARTSWTQAAVAALVTAFHTRTGATDFGEDDTAKLIELGLIPKPSKPKLDSAEESMICKDLNGFTTWDEPQRTLAIRYALKHLQSLLPKRASK